MVPRNTAALIIVVAQAKEHLLALRKELLLSQSGKGIADSYKLIDLLQTDLNQIDGLTEA